MFQKFLMKMSCQVAKHPEILVEAAPILVPMAAVVAVYDVVEYFRK